MFNLRCIPNLINLGGVLRLYEKSVRLVLWNIPSTMQKATKWSVASYINVCDDAFWKQGRCFKWFFFFFLSFCSSSFVDDDEQMCWLFPVCTHRIHFFMSPQRLSVFPFRRCCVNWSRGRQNWFLNHILWKLTFRFFFAFPSHSRLYLARFFSSLSPVLHAISWIKKVHNGTKHLRLLGEFSVSLFL